MAAAFFLMLHTSHLESAGLNFPLQSRWKAVLDSPPEHPPAYDAMHAYIALRDKRFVAIALDTGKTAWSVECPMTAAPAAGDSLAFAGGNGFVQARAQHDGRTQWQTEVEGAVTSLHWDTGWLIATTDQGVLLALRASDGGLVWRRALAAAARGSPALTGDRLYLSTADGGLTVLALATGDPIWTIQLPKPANTILPVGDRVYVGSSDDRFYCLTARNGHVDWRWRTGADVIGMPVLDERHVYFVSLDNMLRALDRNSGSVRWQKSLPMRPSAGPLLTGWTLVVTGVTAELHAYSTQFDGKLAGDLVMLSPENRELQLEGPPHLTADDLLVLTTRGGQMEAFFSSPYPSGP